METNYEEIGSSRCFINNACFHAMNAILYIFYKLMQLAETHRKKLVLQTCEKVKQINYD